MSSKSYVVMKDGEVLKELKTLAVAKKLADTEDAEVFCEGVCVYAPDPPIGVSTLEASAIEAGMEKESVIPEKYTLTARMNIRKSPSLDADKLGIANPGTVVDVIAIEDGWMHLQNDTFILFEGGRFAKKN